MLKELNSGRDQTVDKKERTIDNWSTCLPCDEDDDDDCIGYIFYIGV